MAFGNFTLTGKLLLLDGAPASGRVVVDGAPATVIDTAGDTIRVGSRAVSLDPDGKFTISLPSNATTGNSTTIGFRVTADLSGPAHDVGPVEFYARPIGTTVDLADITPQVVAPLTPTGVSQADFDAYKAANAGGGLPSGGAVDQTVVKVAGVTATWVQEPALVADPARYSNIDLTGATASTGLQTLLDSLPSNSYKKSIRLLPGIYYNPTGFTLDRPNVTLEGAGPSSLGISGGNTTYGTTELRASSAGAACLTIGAGAGASSDWRGAQIRNIGFMDSSAGHDQVTAGVLIRAQNNGVLDNIRAHDLYAGAAITTDATVNPQYWQIINPQALDVLGGIWHAATSSDWHVLGGVLWGRRTSATGARTGSVGIIDRGTMKTHGLSVQYFEREMQLLAGASQHYALTIESLGGFTSPLPVAGVEFGASSFGNRVEVEFANANKYSTGRAVSFLTGSSRNVARGLSGSELTTQRVVDDNNGSTGNIFDSPRYGRSHLVLADSGTPPTADVTTRGIIRFQQNTGSVNDSLWVGRRIAGGTYGWVDILAPAAGGSVGGVLSSTTQATVSNTTVETVLATYTIPAGSAAVGTTYRLVAGGTMDNIATSGTLILRCRVGGVAGVSVAGLTLPTATAANTVKSWRVESQFSFRAIGATAGRVVGTGVANGALGTNTATPVVSSSSANPSTGPDTTTALDYVLTAQWATADPGNIIRCELANFELVKA